MEALSREEKMKIVRDELTLLKEGQFISSKVFEQVVKAHERFYGLLAVKEEWLKRVEVVEREVHIPEPETPRKPKKLKPVKTEEQIRERNITWLLNLGVILLLIGGLYVATSNWETMSSFTKAGSIGLVSLLFYALAYGSKRILRIDKTAFAFIVLGSLFLPIFLLSIGWFELIGPVLSVHGEGRYFFGMLSSLLVLPVYVLLASKLQARLFVWFSYLALFVSIGFLLAALHMGEDGFFLGMMLFQAALIFLYHRVKTKKKLLRFTKEFVYFAQLNLILTSVLMLFLFDSPTYFGFNLILTALIYLAMVYVTGRKEFHFVFTAMLVFGLYQLVEYSFLDRLSSVIYAAIGFVFLLIPKFLNDEYPWKRIFTLTSGVISGLAFLFITIDAFLIKLGEPSIVLFLAYVVIAGNFLYLSHTTNKLLFRYLTAIFISVAMLEGLLFADQWVTVRPFVLFLFLIGVTLFVAGIFVKSKWVDVIKQPARDVGWAYMGLSFYAALAMYAWWEIGVMLLLVSLCAYIGLAKEPRVAFKTIGVWLVPLALGFGIAALSEEIREYSHFYRMEIGVPGHFVLASLVLSILYLRTKELTLGRTLFYVSQGLYTLALLTALAFPAADLWIRPLIFIGGVAMYGWLYIFTKNKYVPYLISVTTLISYFILLNFIGDIGNLDFIMGAVVLFVGALLVKPKELMRSFAFIGHLYLPFALLLSLISYGNDALWSFFIGLIIYAVSTTRAEKEWKIKTFLYSAFTSLFIIMLSGMDLFTSMDGEYVFLFTSIIIAIFWFLSAPVYKKRTQYYFVPFSLLGVLIFISVYPFGMLPFIISLLYAIGIMVILHLGKWQILNVIPTLFIYGATVLYLLYHPFAPGNEIITLAGFGIVFIFAGKWFYPSLFEKPFSFDVYTFAGVLFFLTMYGFEQTTLWTKLLPGVMLIGAICLQRMRVSEEAKWIPTFLAGAYLLQPYYVFINELEIHELLIREAYVLPFVLVGIYLRSCLKGKYEKLTNYLQWGILIVVSFILVVDGLETSTIYDALILGSLSLASIIAGVSLRNKSYFFIGTGVLLLNVFMQTRPFWGNMPWWAYLLIAGTILIAVASSNEWYKQKEARGEATQIGRIKERLIELWKQWR